MLYVDTESFDPCFNFGVEVLFCERHPADEPVMLLWGTDPCVMLGRFQTLRAELSPEYVRCHGITVVRRLSGGGAIYTDRGGRQFSFIEPAGEEISFAPYMRRIAGALRDMGFPVEITGRNDMLLGGKKFSGNAQFRKGGMCVHHGSMLFDTDLEALAAATAPDPEKLISKGVQSVRERVCNLRPADPLGRDVETFAKDLAARVADRSRRLTCQERAEAEEIAKAMFRDPGALYGRDPQCEIVRTRRFAGGTLTAEIGTKGGSITALHFSGDIFGDDPAPLIRKLVGLPHREESLRAAITVSPFYKITAEDLIQLLK